ncbi:hypothetical protein V2A85_22870, partial [Yersinia sp. 1252 StPb PI]
PAFPFVPGEGSSLYESEGMTLRDYFAAKAMAAIISGSLAHGQPFSSNGESDRLAQAAGRVADAMIKARG